MKEINESNIEIIFLEPEREENIKIIADLIKLDVSEKCFTNRDLEGNIIPTEEMASIYLNYAYCYSIVYENNNIGLLCLSNETEVAIFVAPNYQNKGIGKIALSKFLSIVRDVHQVDKGVIAEITPDNYECIHLFEKLGFIDTNESREVTINGLETKVKKYVYNN